jgi:hypothetical protein
LKATLVIVAIAFAGIILGVVFIRHKMALTGKRWLGLLKAYPGFSGKAREHCADMQFQYSDAQDKNLKRLRETYCLDAVAGEGPEIERIVNLMKWVNRLTWHHPNPRIPGPYNALRLITLSKGHRRGINCWMFALTLNEVYLSMGFASRLVHLMPHSNENRESHFAVAVYSLEAGRWLYMDPDFGGFFMDEHGNLLGVAEIRRRLVNGEPLVANRDVRGFTVFLGKGSYPWYLSKNIFKHACAQRSEFDQETDRKDKVYYALIPDGYREELLLEPEITKRGTRIVYINDEELFWQKP